MKDKNLDCICAQASMWKSQPKKGEEKAFTGKANQTKKILTAFHPERKTFKNFSLMA